MWGEISFGTILDPLVHLNLPNEGSEWGGITWPWNFSQAAAYMVKLCIERHIRKSWAGFRILTWLNSNIYFYYVCLLAWLRLSILELARRNVLPNPTNWRAFLLNMSNLVRSRHEAGLLKSDLLKWPVTPLRPLQFTGIPLSFDELSETLRYTA